MKKPLCTLLFFLILCFQKLSTAGTLYLDSSNPQSTIPSYQNYSPTQNVNHDYRHRHYNYPVYTPYFFNVAPTVNFPNDQGSYVNYYSSSANVETSQRSIVSNEYSSYPAGEWVNSSNGQVPNNAIAYNSQRYYCRASYHSVDYYGLLIPNDACYAKDRGVSMRFDQYQVLTK